MTLKSRFKPLAAFLALNFCLSLLIEANFLLHAGPQPLGLFYSAAALVSNTFMIYAALGLAALPLSLFAGGRRVLALAAALLQLLLVTDAAVYRIFHFHLNSMVLNLVLTPGGLESLDQGWWLKAVFIGVALLAVAAQWYFLRLAPRLAGALTARRAWALAGLLLAFVALDKGLYAWGTLTDSVYITRNGQLYPMYQKLGIRSFASKYLGVKLDAEVKGGVDARYSALDYPKAPLSAEAPARRLNFLVLVVDSLRYDMLTPEIMPETSALGRGAAVFSGHYSGGNCTRFGIFSIIYGLYGNYWFPMLGERRGPVLIEELKRQGYDLRVFASTKLSFPEFNKTCFVDVPRSAIYDEPKPGDGTVRDGDVTDKAAAYVGSRRGGRPYFAFVFYDASHGSYDYTPGTEKFLPSHGMNPLLLNKDNILPLFNKYRNSVRFDDHEIGRILAAVRASGGMKDTVIVVTGDHGEPFFEKGYYGHNQSYSAEEVRVPLVLYVPGMKPQVVTSRTSHFDLAPTLLRLAGVKNPPSDYSSGRYIFDGAPGPYAAVFSWDTAAMVRDDRTMQMPLESYKGGVKFFDNSTWRQEGKDASAEFMPLLPSFQKEASRFFK